MSVRQIDIARKLGLSQQAVSAVLTRGGASRIRVSDQTAERIRKAAERMGYRPNRSAQQLAGRRSGVIGALIGAKDSRIVYMQMAELEKLAFERGYRLSVGLVHDENQTAAYVDDFESRGVDGVLCIQHEIPGSNEAIPRRLAQMDHVVYLNKPAWVKQPHYVEVDFADGIYQAVNHLWSRGRRRIAIALPGDKGIAIRGRLSGYKQAMKERGVKLDPSLMWLGPIRHTLEQMHVERIIDEMIVPHFPDAVLASNDEWAVMLSKAVRARGMRVPDDLAIVGYDNIDIARAAEPEITTVDQRLDEVAPRMLEMLLALVEGSTASSRPQAVTIKPRLVVREST